MSQSIQYALVFPALMICTLGIIQAGVWVHGRQVVSAAAIAAVDGSRSAEAGSVAGEAAARRVAGLAGLTDVAVVIDRGPLQVRATVTGTIPMFFDLGFATVTESAAAPVERVTTPAGEFMITEGSSGGN